MAGWKPVQESGPGNFLYNLSLKWSVSLQIFKKQAGNKEDSLSDLCCKQEEIK
jgi:hypothetical protein